VPAAVAAFGLDERTAADWRREAGGRCEAVHRHHPRSRPLDPAHARADELYAKRQGGRSWVAMAMAVPSRLRLGGVLSPIRNMAPIRGSADVVRPAWPPGTAPLVRVGGPSSYATAPRRAFREGAPTGRRGRPPCRLPEGAWLARVIKSRSGRRLPDVARRAAWGTPERAPASRRARRRGRGSTRRTSSG
jgi:hypothetical protein